MKKPTKKSNLEELDSRQQMLEKKMLQAYTAGMSPAILAQIQAQIDMNRMDMYDESERQKFNTINNKPDGEIIDTTSDEEKKRRDDDYIV
jgi:hypothetical protein